MANIKSASKVEMHGQTQIKLREAQLSDAEAAADLLRASITDLCMADHGNRAGVMECWLANKTPHHVCTWITSPGRVVVAERQGRISGVGAAAASGEITLNYVLPIARFSGVSKLVLRDLEEYLRAEGHSVSVLSSTRTAYRFYRAAGYVDAGAPKRWGEMTAFPMIKHISSGSARSGGTLRNAPPDRSCGQRRFLRRSRGGEGRRDTGVVHAPKSCSTGDSFGI